MNHLILGNALCFAASIIMLMIGFIKKKRRFLLAQSGMNAVFIAGNLCLGGISGAITNAATMLRNFYCLRWEFGRWAKLIFVGLQIALAAFFGCDTLIMWLPIIGTCAFTWFMDTENMVLLKAIVIGTQILWAIYDFSIMNYATVPFDIGAAVTNAIGIVEILRARTKTKKE